MKVSNNPLVTIVIPTYNESQNILNILKSIGENIPHGIPTQAIVIDDNSPDGTGRIVEQYIQNVKKIANYTIDIIHRKTKNGLSSAILHGIQHAGGETIVVMDSDFSHPPNIIPKMIDAIKQYHYDIVIASRYITGGTIQGWSLKRKILSKVATLIAKKGLGIKSKDPMSGFFAFKKNLIKELSFDAIGYKILLEILVKTKNVRIKEIPYTFHDRKLGESKLNFITILDYLKSVWKLYKSGRKQTNEKRKSVHFISKVTKFLTVGASGFGINYLISLLFATGIEDFWYLYANIIGIIVSMTSNFILNKRWTFEDKDFSLKKTMPQYVKFVGFSSLGAIVQLSTVFFLIEEHHVSYPLALIIAVSFAAFGNFIFNKKWTFKESIWE